jgi:hypothetical protein
METKKILVGSRKKFTPEEIIYLKSDQNYTNVFLSDGKKVLVSTTLKKIEDRFTGCGFLRVHRSTVVNMSFVETYIDKELSGELILSGNNKIPVSRRKNEKLRNLNLNIVKKISILCICLFSTFFSFAQQSITLDSKSLIVPRYANLSAITAAMTSPQTGMMVYNIGTQTNWTYNGTAWVNAAGLGSSQWTTSGTTINYSTGNVGIGIVNPAYPLASKGRIQIFDQGGGESAGLWLNNNGNTLLNTFIGIDPTNQFGVYSPVLGKNIFLANMTNAGIRLDGPSVPSPAVTSLSLGGYGKVSVDAAGIIGGRMTILENGNVGLGNTNPVEKLEINGNLRINNGGIRFLNSITQSNGISSSNGYLILSGGDASSGNGVWINNTGSVIGGIKFQTSGAIEIASTEGNNGQILTSGGPGNNVLWKNPILPLSFNLPLSPVFTVLNNNENTLPAPALLSISVPTAGKLIIWPSFQTRYDCTNPFDHCYLSWTFKTFLNGSVVATSRIQSTYAYLQQFNDNAVAPIVLNIASGSHVITFSETLHSISLNPDVRVEAYAQFIPN